MLKYTHMYTLAVKLQISSLQGPVEKNRPVRIVAFKVL